MGLDATAASEPIAVAPEKELMVAPRTQHGTLSERNYKTHPHSRRVHRTFTSAAFSPASTSAESGTVDGARRNLAVQDLGLARLFESIGNLTELKRVFNYAVAIIRGRIFCKAR